MKFLVLQKIRPEIPVDTWAKLLPAQFKYLDKLEKETAATYHEILDKLRTHKNKPKRALIYETD